MAAYAYARPRRREGRPGCHPEGRTADLAGYLPRAEEEFRYVHDNRECGPSPAAISMAPSSLRSKAVA